MPKNEAYRQMKVTDGWLPTSEDVLKELGVKDGDIVEYYVSHDQLVVRRVNLLNEPPKKKAKGKDAKAS